MCGIAGLISPLSHPPEVLGKPFVSLPNVQGSPPRSIMAAMVSAMHHRGPDGRGMWAAAVGDHEICLGHARLAILDLTDAARQPMRDPASGCVLVYNGEIYNFQQLREELLREEGTPFDSSGDAQVLLRAYVRWGPPVVKKLRGMFAFGIYDPGNNWVFLARDHLGIKPLYVAEGADGSFAFASEVRALLEIPWVHRSLDPVGLLGYLAYGSVQDPYTLVSGIRSVPPGHSLILDLSKGRLMVGEPRSYYEFSEIQPAVTEEPPGEAARRVRKALHESVRLHLVSDVPLGVFLSGGMDSTALVALASEAGPAEINTLTVSFEEAAFDESEMAKAVAKRYATRHTEIHLTASDFLENIPHWLRSLDLPSADGANVWIISKACKEARITVALSGLGSDELFGGYPAFPRTAKAGWLFGGLAWLPRPVRMALADAIRTVGKNSIAAEKLAEWTMSSGSRLTTYLILRRIFMPRVFEEILIPQIAVSAGRLALPPEVFEKLSHFAETPDPYTAVSLLEMNTYMVNTLLRDADQMGMAHSLEIRVPFLDINLAELVLSLKKDADPANGNKPLLSAALREKMDPAWARRPKMTFTLPFDYWLRGSLRKEVEHSLMGLAGFPFKPGAVRDLWQNFLQNPKQVNSSQIILLYTLASWMNQHQIQCVP